MIQFRTLLCALHSNGVAFVIIGGVAGTLHGSARVTYDLDVVYERSPDNLKRMVAALRPYEPYLRGAPPRVFRLDLEAIAELETIKEERQSEGSPPNSR